jgi:hypothetical protein
MPRSWWHAARTELRRRLMKRISPQEKRKGNANWRWRSCIAGLFRKDRFLFIRGTAGPRSQPQTQVRNSSRHPRSHTSALTSRSCVRFTFALRTDTIDIQSPRFPAKNEHTNSALPGKNQIRQASTSRGFRQTLLIEYPNTLPRDPGQNPQVDGQSPCMSPATKQRNA